MMDKKKNKVNKKNLKKQVTYLCEELVNLYTDWANNISKLSDPKLIHKLSLNFGKMIVDQNKKISKLTVENNIKRIDYSEYTRPRINAINECLKRYLNKSNYDYIFRIKTRDDFIKEEHKFNTNKTLEWLDTELSPKLIKNDFLDKKCHSYLIDLYSKEFNKDSKELLNNEKFKELFIDSCIDYENCYLLHFDEEGNKKTFEYAKCYDGSHLHKKIKQKGDDFVLIEDICEFYKQSPVRKFYRNIIYKYLIEDAWIFGENNQEQLNKINQDYLNYSQNSLNIENLKIIDENKQNVIEFAINKQNVLTQKQQEQINEFIQFLLINKAKWHNRISYINFDYIYKKESIDLVIDEVNLNDLDYLIIYLDNLNGINYIDQKIWQIIDFIKSINKSLRNKPKTKVIFFNNIKVQNFINRLKRWNNDYEYDDLKQALIDLFYENKSVVDFVFKKNDKKLTKNNSRNIDDNKQHLNKKRVKNTDDFSDNNAIDIVNSYLENDKELFTNISDIIKENKTNQDVQKIDSKIIKRTILIIHEIDKYLNKANLSSLIFTQHKSLQEKMHLIYQLAHLEKNRKLADVIENSLLNEYFQKIYW
ncbi:hypothetical protein LNO75_01715 [Mycoplasma sp. T363T]|nr:hypothetical protein [Mycoplasma bradburyae]